MAKKNLDENPYWKNICAMAEKQRQKGIKTYGQGLEMNTADILTRLEYLQEELIDGLMYIEWIKQAVVEKGNNMPRKYEPIKTFPRRLRIALATQEMTSADLMRKSTLGGSQISEYLNGHNEPTVTSLYKLCIGLGVSADFLLGFSDDIKLKKRGK